MDDFPSNKLLDDLSTQNEVMQSNSNNAPKTPTDLILLQYTIITKITIISHHHHHIITLFQYITTMFHKK